VVRGFTASDNQQINDEIDLNFEACPVPVPMKEWQWHLFASTEIVGKHESVVRAARPRCAASLQGRMLNVGRGQSRPKYVGVSGRARVATAHPVERLVPSNENIL
jgi:hypothetical protein